MNKLTITLTDELQGYAALKNLGARYLASAPNPCPQLSRVFWFEAQEMLAYRHSGFSVDTSVCIAAHDRAGLERLLRYCARPPFACARLRKAGSELVYRCAKQHSEPGSKPHNKRGAKVDEITLTPLELIDRIAALVPPPRTH